MNRTYCWLSEASQLWILPEFSPLPAVSLSAFVHFCGLLDLVTRIHVSKSAVKVMDLPSFGVRDKCRTQAMNLLLSDDGSMKIELNTACMGPETNAREHAISPDFRRIKRGDPNSGL